MLEARARTAGVLALAVSLRRGIDAGVPIGQECAALRATGPFPAPVDQALTQLTAIADGIPTMRDLADAFDLVESRVATLAEGSSLGPAWMRVRSALALGEPSGDEIVLQRLRMLAAGGQFSEAATVLKTRRWRTWEPSGSPWCGRGRRRSSPPR